MMIYEFDKITQFTFECDLIIDNKMVAQFDDAKVTVVTDLLLEHGVTNWQVRLGMNDAHQRTVTVEIHEKIPELFHYDLSTLMLSSKY